MHSVDVEFVDGKEVLVGLRLTKMEGRCYPSIRSNSLIKKDIEHLANLIQLITQPAVSRCCKSPRHLL